MEMMTDEEKKEFYMDVKNINWENCLKLYAYGVQKYMMGRDPISPLD